MEGQRGKVRRGRIGVYIGEGNGREGEKGDEVKEMDKGNRLV